MTESDFWPRLEYRVCREFEGLRDEALRGLWCDGFLPHALHTEATAPRIIGDVWIGRGPREQEEWRFALLLPPHVRDAGQIDWAVLLPAEDVTGWLAIDVRRRTMRITPHAAYPGRE